MSRPAPIPRGLTAWTLGVVLLVAAVLLAAHLHGRQGRGFAAPRVARVVASPAEVGPLWRGLGVKGRVLLLFDRYPHARPDGPVYLGAPHSAEDLVGYGVFQNVVRRVYLVIPDDDWAAFRERAPLYRPLREVPRSPRPVPLFTYSGAPLVAVTPSSLPPLGEAALVYVNGDLFDPAGVERLLASRGIASDVFVALRPGGAP